MHFLRPPSCGDGIKALLSLFDFQQPPITAGHWLIIVPLQSLGMALLTPPTRWLPLKVMVTPSCRTQELWNICCSEIDSPSELLDFWFVFFFALEAGDQGAEETLGYHGYLDFLISPLCMNRFKLFHYWTWRMQSIRGECWLAFIGSTPSFPACFVFTRAHLYPPDHASFSEARLWWISFASRLEAQLQRPSSLRHGCRPRCLSPGQHQDDPGGPRAVEDLPWNRDRDDHH